ncbi:hypothetical protein P3X46_032605 [Hevea brasiliensis]|uniref:Uncharacterized protein n=1 Tax=Hevea brasiliensis TaxID=3981 RepID=A0ABQ9KEY8_HEVBR|nr:uncharacterized protein LOC110662895 [Hevea brasiliensis]KAJ9135419.1 hypothetical protein P3X46_032605 [Hevea brasiliensis]
MKREGRQHGLVRTYRILPSPWNPKPNSRFINSFDSPPTAGLFSKVHPRPTNHSKFTSKCARPRCNGCHMHPCYKSKDKTKGTQKLKSLDVASNYRLINGRLVNSGPGLKFSGFSASGILDHLTNIEDDYVDDEIGGDLENSILSSQEKEAAHEIEEITAANVDDDENRDDVNGLVDDDDDDENRDDVNGLVDDDDENRDGDNGLDDDDAMSFCDLSYVLDQVEEDEGWCLVAEM